MAWLMVTATIIVIYKLVDIAYGGLGLRVRYD
jgi:hypothetical protein